MRGASRSSNPGAQERPTTYQRRGSVPPCGGRIPTAAPPFRSRRRCSSSCEPPGQIGKDPHGGVTFPTKLLLEKDGVRADAIFRDINEQRATPISGGGRNELFFRDSYVFEPAAYELSRLLGLDNVPPAALRTLKKNGSVQIWVENAMTERGRIENNPSHPHAELNKQQVMNVSTPVYNTDRNRGTCSHAD